MESTVTNILTVYNGGYSNNSQSTVEVTATVALTVHCTVPGGTLTHVTTLTNIITVTYQSLFWG